MVSGREEQQLNLRVVLIIVVYTIPWRIKLWGWRNKHWKLYKLVFYLHCIDRKFLSTCCSHKSTSTSPQCYDNHKFLHCGWTSRSKHLHSPQYLRNQRLKEKFLDYSRNRSRNWLRYQIWKTLDPIWRLNHNFQPRSVSHSHKNNTDDFMFLFSSQTNNEIMNQCTNTDC